MIIDSLIKKLVVLTLALSVMVLSGCHTNAKRGKAVHHKNPIVGGYDTDGFPDDVPEGIENIPDAVPKPEPYSKYGNPESYSQFGRNYKVLKSAKGYAEKGKASWYGKKFHGRRTSSGESYNMFGMTAAHKTLPIPSYVKVKNLDNNKEVILKVNDRGPFHVDRIIDLSYSAAAKLGILGKGTGHVQVTSIVPSAQEKLMVAKSGAPAPKAAVAKDKATVIAANTLSVTPSASPATLPSKVSSSQSGIYIQLGAFSNIKSAQVLADKAKGLGMDENVLILEASSKHAPVYRVRIGPIANESKAKDLKNTLISKQYSAQQITLD